MRKNHTESKVLISVQFLDLIYSGLICFGFVQFRDTHSRAKLSDTPSSVRANHSQQWLETKWYQE